MTLRGASLMLSLLLITARAWAHPLAPAALLLDEQQDGSLEATYRTTPESDARLELIIDTRCSVVREDAVVADGTSVVRTGLLRCTGGIDGATFRVRGLSQAGVSAVVQVRRVDGTVAQALLNHGDAAFTVPTRGSRASVFVEYLRLGAEHLWTGLDHALFLLMLLLAVRDRVRALWMLTAFTVGHSLTLALTALDVVDVPQAGAEVGIAVSLVWMAATAAVPYEDQRTIGWVTAGFGLLHGLGFAGVLREVGLTPGQVPLSLFAFNLGIELGQVLLALLAWTSALLLSSLGPLVSRARSVLVYASGVLAALWVMERGAELF